MFCFRKNVSQADSLLRQDFFVCIIVIFNSHFDINVKFIGAKDLLN